MRAAMRVTICAAMREVMRAAMRALRSGWQVGRPEPAEPLPSDGAQPGLRGLKGRGLAVERWFRSPGDRVEKSLEPAGR